MIQYGTSYTGVVKHEIRIDETVFRNIIHKISSMHGATTKDVPSGLRIVPFGDKVDVLYAHIAGFIEGLAVSNKSCKQLDSNDFTIERETLWNGVPIFRIKKKEDRNIVKYYGEKHNMIVPKWFPDHWYGVQRSLPSNCEHKEKSLYEILYGMYVYEQGKKPVETVKPTQPVEITLKKPVEVAEPTKKPVEVTLKKPVEVAEPTKKPVEVTKPVEITVKKPVEITVKKPSNDFFVECDICDDGTRIFRISNHREPTKKPVEAVEPTKKPVEITLKKPVDVTKPTEKPVEAAKPTQQFIRLMELLSAHGL
jgi:hypothetical protein